MRLPMFTCLAIVRDRFWTQVYLCPEPIPKSISWMWVGWGNSGDARSTLSPKGGGVGLTAEECHLPHSGPPSLCPVLFSSLPPSVFLSSFCLCVCVSVSLFPPLLSVSLSPSLHPLPPPFLQQYLSVAGAAWGPQLGQPGRVGDQWLQTTAQGHSLSSFQGLRRRGYAWSLGDTAAPRWQFRVRGWVVLALPTHSRLIWRPSVSFILVFQLMFIVYFLGVRSYLHNGP